jgi:RHS repeat-associated protein
VVLSGAVGEREPGIPDGWIEHPIPRRKGKPGAAGYGKNATVLIVSVAATGLDSDYRHIRPLFSGRATKGHNATKSYSEVEVKSLYGATQTQTGRVFNRPATEAFTHDADGNLTQDGRWTYVWDGENRLIEMKRDTDTPAGARQRLVFEYDHQGRRIRKQFYTHNGSSWVLSSDTAFAYDGWNLVGELNAAASNARLRTFLWGLDLSGSEQGAGGVGGLWLVIDYTNDTTYHWPAYDGNGNMAALVAQANGSLSARYEYGPFGEAIRATGPMARKNPFRFSTKFTDNETGLIYYGYRFYDPVTGRWLNRDPIGERGGANLVGFVKNQPISIIDRLGLQLGGHGFPGRPISPPTGDPCCEDRCDEEGRLEVVDAEGTTCPGNWDPEHPEFVKHSQRIIKSMCISRAGYARIPVGIAVAKMHDIGTTHMEDIHGVRLFTVLSYRTCERSRCRALFRLGSILGGCSPLNWSPTKASSMRPCLPQKGEKSIDDTSTFATREIASKAVARCAQEHRAELKGTP